MNVAANWVELQGSIQEIYDSYIKQKTDYSKMFFNFKNTKRDVDTHLGTGTFGRMQVWDGQLNKVDIRKGYKTTYIQDKYSIATDIEQKLILFENYDEIERRVKRLADSVLKTNNYWSAYYFNNAWDSSVTGGSNAGLPLASASHRVCPGDDAGVQSNTGNEALDIDAIEDIRIAARGWMDDKGEIMDVNLNTIICGSYWEKTAMQICGSDKEPYTADNQTNIYARGKSSELKYIVNPYISGRIWGLANRDEMTSGNGLNWKWGQKPGAPELNNDFTTDIATYAIRGWWATGFDTWYWIRMSQGTN